jgi:hypothetical protein
VPRLPPGRGPRAGHHGPATSGQTAGAAPRTVTLPSPGSTPTRGTTRTPTSASCCHTTPQTKDSLLDCLATELAETKQVCWPRRRCCQPPLPCPAPAHLRCTSTHERRPPPAPRRPRRPRPAPRPAADAAAPPGRPWI